MKTSRASVVRAITTWFVLALPLATLQAAESASGAVACEALKSVAIPHTEIATAETVAAGAFKSPLPDLPWMPVDYSRLPAFCRVAGSIEPSSGSDIRFELWMPLEGWNGRFLQTGNGGSAGSIVYPSLADPLLRGYAVANTDTGHQGGGGEFTWVPGHPEKFTDYAYRAVHELTVAGKAIVKARYGRKPARSYWFGCSTGGRQGLKEAQEFPEDYDAVIAGAPANNWTPLMALSLFIQQNLTGPLALGVDKLPLLKEAALAACDEKDGVKDRVISDPKECDFDPEELQCAGGPPQSCLSETEVAAAQRIYGGIVDAKSKHVLIPGTGPASEPMWGAYVSPGFRIGESYFGNVVAKDANWDIASFNVDTDVERIEQAGGSMLAAVNPDLGKFFARGGRLILYHGTADGLIPYGNSVNYYESVRAKLGSKRTDEHLRFYLVPGMGHCSGGDGAFAVDWLSAMETWAELGQAPGELKSAHLVSIPGVPEAMQPTSRPFTRPLCVYPQVATYSGKGDSADAANYRCD